MTNEIELDELDVKLLRQCKSNPNTLLKEIITPLTCERAEKTLYARLTRLDELGYVKLDRASYRGRTFCDITELGEHALREHESSHPEGGELQ